MTLIEHSVEGSRMRSLIEQWDGEQVVARFDRPTGSWMFIALHSSRLGAPSGGTRMRVYESPDDALADAMRLAEGMTFKWAAIDFPAGGGKAVLAVPRPLHGEERQGLFRRYGAFVESLHGGFSTGADYGTTPADMGVVRGETGHVHGVGADGRRTIDGGYYTAAGILSGMRAAARELFESDDLAGRSVLVQGVGEVGGPLVALLARCGARVLVGDLDEARALSLAERCGAEVVAPDRILDTACDIYAPCAVGAVLNRHSVPALRCRAVAGSANNQLESAEDADRLHRRGILYAPDYVINSGAALVFGLASRGVAEPAELERRVATIGDLLADLFRQARERRESPEGAAARHVQRILARGPVA